MWYLGKLQIIDCGTLKGTFGVQDIATEVPVLEINRQCRITLEDRIFQINCILQFNCEILRPLGCREGHFIIIRYY